MTHLTDELPKDTKEYLEKILTKNPSWLSKDEIAFLKARSDYLTDENKRVFSSVLEEADLPTKAELVAKMLELNPEADEKTLKKMKIVDLQQAITDKEAELANI